MKNASFSHMSITRPKRPNLQKLKGTYIIPIDVRNDSNLNKDILKITAKHWSNYEDVVENYLTNANVWEKNGLNFLGLLQTSFHQLKNYVDQIPATNSTATLLLLSNCVTNLFFFL